ncbi:flocculation protein FLO11 [Tripterygium wilfordii]|uniref:flocculation protein FLO11 n=1 Tax=Tripterygium wilfordii TaxID=458696 RepID=UPI0018F83EF4|nr:flocculation protein FLO11 [Tripterygium wilfordii]
MDPPPLPPQPTTIPTSMHSDYPDSVEFSPRSLTTETIHDHLPPVPGAKLRLMCSYGGHIMPRPHDKVLCYVGGDTRMVVVDSHSTLSSLATRLSRSLLNGRAFTLKYQLPNEDLDSLVSVTTDEDLDNMIEEYERITSASNSSSSSCRIRLFLFFNKPETVASMGALLDDAKSETWFVDALNGSGLMSRNLSDSATVDCLLNFDDGEEIEEKKDQGEKNKQVEQSSSVMPVMPDSPFVENSSSSSSLPSMANLPPIRVRIEDQKVGLEEQFSQMASVQVVQKQEEGFGIMSAVVPQPAVSQHMNRILSDNDRSDQGAPIGFRKPPLPLPLQPVQQKACSSYNLPSPDSVASDSSIASANSLSKQHIYHQAPTSPNTKGNASLPTPQIQIPDSEYSSPPQFDPNQQQQQLQYVHASTQFIPHQAATPVPITSYYQMYAPQSQHQPADHHQQYPSPVYFMPVTQTLPYMSTADTTVAASGRPVTPPFPTMITPSMAYKDANIPPVYPTKTGTAAAPMPEMGGDVYRTAMTSNPPPAQIPSNQYQQQYVGYAQMQQHPAQSIAASTACYGYDQYYNTAVPDHQMYYSHHHQASSTPLPSQFQTMTPTAAAIALADASNQLPTDTSTSRQQNITSSQPL